MRLRLTFAGLLILRIITACQLIAGIGDKTLWDGAVIHNPCGQADLPAPPTNAADTPKNTYITALSKIFLGSSDGGPYYGFNLDGTCTGQFGEKDSCIQLTPDAALLCDDDGGIDNYARHAFEAINSLVPD